MTESAKPKNDVPVETSIPEGAVPVESILCTEELRRRPWRSPDHKKENRALVALANALAASPHTILQTLAETILDVTQSDSSGVSLLTTDDGGKRFYWPAIAGIWKPHIGGGTPRNFGPCGDVLDRNTTLLFKHVERRYTYFLPVTPLVEECLLAPFYVGGKAVGTIWAIMHDESRKFDAEDERLMLALGQFASLAYQTLASIDDLKVQIAEREKSETALHELTNALETRVRVRTEELEQRNKEVEGLRDHFRLVVDTTPALIHTSQPDGYLDFFNQRWLEYLGLSLDDVCGWRWTEAIHPQDVEDIVQKWRAALASGEPFEAETRVRRADGEYRRMLHRKVPLRDSRGKILKWYGSSLDIEDRRRAEDELKRSEFYLAEGQRLAHTGSWAFNPSGFYDYWSQELFHIYGLDPAKGAPTLAEYLGAVHPQDREFMAETIGKMLAQGLGCDLKKRILRPDGELRYVRCVGVPVFDNGILKSIVGTAIDVTEQELMTQELRRREAYLAEAQRLSHTGSFGWNVVSGEIFWSEETFRIFQYERTTKPTVDLVLQRVHPEDRALVQKTIDRASQDGTDFDLDHRLLMQDGSVKYVHVVGHALSDECGSTEFVGSVMDVTEQHHGRAALQTAFEEIKKLKDQLSNENIALREEIDKVSMFEEIVGESPALHAVLARVAKVAPTDSTVLITGETGTGKELVARAIHKRSRRSSRAFVSVNCAAIPRDLIASELFGHEKGAFTGATQRRLGRFELAEGGTIFLDEIGELPAETQIALLRVLQEHEFERVGGIRSIQSDVRVIAATNRDPQAAIAEGTFRSDLFYRLNVFPIEIPPLRERREDIPLLVEYFIDRYARKAGKSIRRVSKKTLDLLQLYPWPGNIRELQNVIERSVIVCETESFSVDESWLSRQPLTPEPKSQPELHQKLAAQEKEMIETALRESGGRVYGPSGAAAKLGTPRSTLESKIRSLKINKNRFKTAKPAKND